MIIRLLLFAIIAIEAWGQCGANGKLIINGVTGLPDCTGLPGAGTGTVTSVGITGTANQISVSGSPVTTAGSMTLSIPSAFVLPGTINGMTLTSSTGTFTLANGKTATISNTLTFAGTDGSTITLGAGGTVLYSGGALGTPSSGTLTNATGLPVSTGISGLGTGVATWLATPSSANLAAAVTGETGSGALMFGTSPTASGLTLSDVTGSTQCLHVNSSGVISGTGSDCGSGGGSTTAFTTVSFSATPTYTVTASTSIQVFKITQTANITSSTLTATNATAGQSIIFEWCQDSTGGFTNVLPTNVTGAGTPDTTPSTCSMQMFAWNATASEAQAVGGMICPLCSPAVLLPAPSGGGSVSLVSATGASNVTATFPQSTGTVAILDASQALTNKTYNGLTVTSSTGTLTITNGKTMSFGNSITINGTDSTTMTMPSTSQTIPGMNQTNTAGSSMVWDMGAASSMKIPVSAGAAPATNGQIAYDSTNNMLHAAQSGADAKIPQFTITPASDGNCVKWVVSGSNYKLGDAGAACGSGSGTAVVGPVGFAGSFSNGGSALTAGTTVATYLRINNACTISGYNIIVDTGTATFKTWRKAAGTAIPTISDSISTSGVSISSGTVVNSSTVTDWTDTTLDAGDIIGINLSAVSSATQATFQVRCDGASGLPDGQSVLGSLLMTAITAPGTPAAGKGSFYVDSTSKNIAVKDDAGVVKHGVQTDTGTANNYISAISDAGAITKSRPACATLSDSGVLCTASYANNAQTSTYQVLAGDFTNCKTITVASGTFTITLVASGSQPADGTCVRVLNYGSGVVTIARSGQNINGGTTSLTLPASSATSPAAAWIRSDGTNYFANVISPLNSATLTSTRVPFADSNGRLTDDSDFTFATDTATITKIAATTSLTVAGAFVTNNVVQNSQSAAYTTVLGDAGKHIYHPSSDNNARTFTIDSNANVAYPIGTTLTFVNEINTVTIAITSDTLVLAGTGSTGSRTLAANGIATAIKVTSTRWVINGTGLT